MGGHLYRLTPIDITARKHPLAIAWFNRPPHQHDVTVVIADDRAHGYLGIEVEHESTLHAREPLGLSGFQQARVEASTADGTEPERRLVMRVHPIIVVDV